MSLGKLIKDMIRSNTLSYHEGRLEILGLRGVVLPARTYVKILEETEEKTEEDVLDILFEIGLEHGKIAVNDVGRENNTSPRQFIEQVIRTANVMGIGKIEVEYYDLEEKVLITSIKGSPTNSFFKESDTLDYDQPIHQLWRGAIHAMSEGIFRSEIDSQEEKCEYLGDDKCVIRCEGV